VFRLKEKNNTTLVSLLSNGPQVIQPFYDWHIYY